MIFSTEAKPKKKWLIMAVTLAVVIAVGIAVIVGIVHNMRSEEPTEPTSVHDVDRMNLSADFEFGDWLLLDDIPVFSPRGESRPTLPQLTTRKWTTPKVFSSFSLPIMPIYVELEGSTLAQISSSDGPTSSYHGVYTGYAHSIQGALLAGINAEAAMVSCGATQAEATEKFGGMRIEMPCEERPQPLVTIPRFVRLSGVQKDLLIFDMAYDYHETMKLRVERTVVVWKNNDWVAEPGRLDEKFKSSFIIASTDVVGHGWITWREQ